MKKVILLLGGVRSGKSRYAQAMAPEIGKKILFVATAEALDKEMQHRIEVHKKNRPQNWCTLEVTRGIGKKIESDIGDSHVVIIDCITMLVSNLVGEASTISESDYRTIEDLVNQEIKELIECINRVKAHFVIVSNEVGLGIVPQTGIGRLYRDILGKVNQDLASIATEVYLMVAGIPVAVKSPEDNNILP
ncbi:MAG: bifunctional adenosylcobinamide kinase/adenosylcobinamide-phosphate guanylyltransferase [Chloroflexi bacterium]|nr:bifunctional adenosylcobinamide kinase/adenosylcobinamide-phosphate guanylyltransferase [Chloroflexota bacterium]